MAPRPCYCTHRRIQRRSQSDEVLATALPSEDEFSVLTEQHSLLKALRVCAWVSRFLTNSRNLKPRRVKGPLTTDEMKYQETWSTRRAQEEGRSSKNFKADKLQLNLQQDKTEYWSVEDESSVHTLSTFLMVTHSHTSLFNERM